MPLHHHLPATYLAAFSPASAGPRRARPIVVGDKSDGRVFRTAAQAVAAVQGLYTLNTDGVDPEEIEKLWSRYEDDLGDALDALVAGSTDAVTWARVLVPFVAATLVRGPDFNKRFEARLGSLAHVGPTNPDNTNMARLLDLQRLLGPVAAARWVLMGAEGDGGFIMNDVGFTGYFTPCRELGVVIPVAPRWALGVVPQRDSVVASARDGRWWPVVERVALDPGSHRGLNQQLALEARRFVFGADEATVGAYLPAAVGQHGWVREPGDLGFPPPRLARVHEFLWHRLVAALSHSPEEPTDPSFPLDLATLALGWAPRLFFPFNLPEFPAGLERVGDEIRAHLYEVAGFTDADPCLPLVPIGSAFRQSG